MERFYFFALLRGFFRLGFFDDFFDPFDKGLLAGFEDFDGRFHLSKSSKGLNKQLIHKVQLIFTDDELVFTLRFFCVLACAIHLLPPFTVQIVVLLLPAYLDLRQLRDCHE